MLTKLAAPEVEAEGPFRARSVALLLSALALQVRPQRHEMVQVELLLTALIPVMAETGVIAFAGVSQEQGVIEDLTAQGVWVAEGGSPVQTVHAVVPVVLRSTDEAAAADEQEYSEHSLVAVAAAAA